MRIADLLVERRDRAVADPNATARSVRAHVGKRVLVDTLGVLVMTRNMRSDEITTAASDTRSQPF